METVTDGSSKITADDSSHEIKKILAPGKKSCDQPRQHIKKQRHYFANRGLSSQSSSVAQSCPTLSMDCSPPGSSIHGIFQARILEWGAIALMGWHLKAFPARTFYNVMVPWLLKPKELTCCLRGLASQKTKQQKWLRLGKQLSAGQGQSIPLLLLKWICTGRTELVGWVRDRDGERD